MSLPSWAFSGILFSPTRKWYFFECATLEVVIGPHGEDRIRVEGVEDAVGGPDASLVAHVVQRLRVQLCEEENLVARPGLNTVVLCEERGDLVLDLACQAVADALRVGHLLDVARQSNFSRPSPALREPPSILSPKKLIQVGGEGGS